MLARSADPLETRLRVLDGGFSIWGREAVNSVICSGRFAVHMVQLLDIIFDSSEKALFLLVFIRRKSADAKPRSKRRRFLPEKNCLACNQRRPTRA
jgi:hypothetical protein